MTKHWNDSHAQKFPLLNLHVFPFNSTSSLHFCHFFFTNLFRLPLKNESKASYNISLEWGDLAAEVSPAQPLNGWRKKTFSASQKATKTCASKPRNRLFVLFVRSTSMRNFFLHSIRVRKRAEKPYNYLISCEVCVSLPSLDSRSRRRLREHFAAFMQLHDSAILYLI